MTKPTEAFTGLHTPRLQLRPLTLEDGPALHRVLGDEIAMAAYEHGFSPDETADWITRQLARYERDGFGLWAMVDAGTGELIGDCGLTIQVVGEAQVVEVGYHLVRERWGHGYATEAASGCLAWGFTHLNAPEIYARVRDTNIASMNVAIRLGMTVRERFTIHYRDIDMPHLAFAITRQAWHSRHPSR